VITDNTGVKYLKEAKASYMLVRWALSLQEFDFYVVHRAGRLSTNVDVLSRFPVPRSNDDLEFMTLEEVTEGVNRTFAEELFHEQCEEFGPKEGLGFLRDALGRIRVPKSMRTRILSLIHDRGHSGVSKTYAAINRRFTWEGMKADVRRYISSCRPCLDNKLYVWEKKKWWRLQFGDKFGVVFIDLKDFSSNPSEGQRYILVALDAKSRLIELASLPNKEAKTVARAFFQSWISRYGFPSKVKSDLGKEFNNQFFKELTVLTGVEHEMGRVDHHEDQARVERFMRTIEEAE
jgi:transposase InsO family protein